MPLSTQIQQVIVSIQTLKIDATYDNMNHLLGCLMKLNMIRDELATKEAEAKNTEVNQNGTKREHESAVPAESNAK